MIQRVKANQKIEREKLKANQKKIWKKEKNVLGIKEQILLPELCHLERNWKPEKRPWRPLSLDSWLFYKLRKCVTSSVRAVISPTKVNQSRCAWKVSTISVRSTSLSRRPAETVWETLQDT